jgi:hypothetical protein
MVYATQTFNFSSQEQVLAFSDMLYDWAEKLEDLAWVKDHKPQNSTYHDASILDTIVSETHADSSD